MKAEKILKLLLWLIALHAFVVGVFLMTGTRELFLLVGFPYHGGFFSVQSGLFYLVMVVAFLITAYHLNKQSFLIWFCITAKLMAAVFLVLYYVFFEPVIIVLISGAADLFMGLLLLYLYHLTFRQTQS